MNCLRIESCSPEPSRERVGYHHGAVTPARATYSNSHIRLSFAFVKRQKIIQQIMETAQGLFYLRLRFQILNYAPVMPRQLAQLRHEIRIRQMPYIKEQLHLRRASVLVAETQDLHAHGRAFHRRAETIY